MSHLPVLVLWLEGYHRAVFAARQDVFWGSTVDLFQLVALLLPLTAVCDQMKEKRLG